MRRATAVAIAATAIGIVLVSFVVSRLQQKAIGPHYELRGKDCRRELLKDDQKVCDAVVIPHGVAPCSEVYTIHEAALQLEGAYGSGCRGPNRKPDGPMGLNLFFVENDEGGFDVLCDGVTLSEEHEKARVACLGSK